MKIPVDYHTCSQYHRTKKLGLTLMDLPKFFGQWLQNLSPGLT